MSIARLSIFATKSPSFHTCITRAPPPLEPTFASSLLPRHCHTGPRSISHKASLNYSYSSPITSPSVAVTSRAFSIALLTRTCSTSTLVRPHTASTLHYQIRRNHTNSTETSSRMTTNGVTTRSKRKQDGVAPASDRPMKQRKSEPEPVEEEEDEMSLDGDISPRAMNGIESEDEEGMKISGKVAAIAETKEWQATIERVVSTAVSIVRNMGYEYQGNVLTHSSSTFVKRAHSIRILPCRVKRQDLSWTRSVVTS